MIRLGSAGHRLGQFIADGLLGLAIFLLIAGLIGGDGGARAEAGQRLVTSPLVTVDANDEGGQVLAQLFSEGLTERVDSARALPAQSPPDSGWLSRPTAQDMLALVFSVLFALNLGFWRHLRRAYPITW